MEEWEYKFLETDGIDLIKFRANLEIMRNGSKEIYQASAKLQNKNDISNHCTESIEWMASPLHQPVAYPTWFMAAYPDVVKWCSELEDTQITSIIGEPTNDFIDEKSNFKIEILRNIVNAYRSNHALECSLR